MRKRWKGSSSNRSLDWIALPLSDLKAFCALICETGKLVLRHAGNWGSCWITWWSSVSREIVGFFAWPRAYFVDWSESAAFDSAVSANTLLLLVTRTVGWLFVSTALSSPMLFFSEEIELLGVHFVAITESFWSVSHPLVLLSFFALSDFEQAITKTLKRLAHVHFGCVFFIGQRTDICCATRLLVPLRVPLLVIGLTRLASMCNQDCFLVL